MPPPRANAEFVCAMENVLGVYTRPYDERRPVVRCLPDGTRVAFLAYSSILPEGYRALERRAGCAPLRAHTLYEQIELDQPGTPARVRTVRARARTVGH